MKKTAKLSPCGYYRYNLTRTWDDKLPKLVWCMLNPSKADHLIDDPTIKKCVGFTRIEGLFIEDPPVEYGGIIVVNLWPLRATDPSDLLEVPIPHKIIQENMLEIAEAVNGGQHVMVAWGCSQAVRLNGEHVNRVVGALAALTNNIYCLGKTKEGHPRHPLYVPYYVQPTPYP